MACAALHNLCKLDGAVLAGIIAVPMTLALSKAFRLVRYTSHPNTTALESLPLLAGSTAGLLLLVSSRPLVPPQYTASVILAVGALAIIPLLISRCKYDFTFYQFSSSL